MPPNKGKNLPANESMRDRIEREAKVGQEQKKAQDKGLSTPPGPKDGRDEPAPESNPSKVVVPKRNGERFW